MNISGLPRSNKNKSLHQRHHLNHDQTLHSVAPWDRYGVVWATEPFKGFDLLVLATNNHPARPDCRRGAI